MGAARKERVQQHGYTGPNLDCLEDQYQRDPRRLRGSSADLEQVIRDMAEAIAQARGQTAEVIAQEKLIEADYLKNHRLSQEWERKTELALTRGSDDLAREALRRKIDFERNAEMLGRQPGGAARDQRQAQARPHPVGSKVR